MLVCSPLKCYNFITKLNIIFNPKGDLSYGYPQDSKA
jgi:hypothetical protein